MIPVPQLTPEAVNALNAYALAGALAAVCLVVGAVLRFLPSKTAKREGRDLMRDAFAAVVLSASIMTAGFLIGYANQLAGIPDWQTLIRETGALRESGYGMLSATASIAIQAAFVVAVIDIVLKPLHLIGTFVAHMIFAVLYTALSFFAALSVLLVMLTEFVLLAARFASIAYVLVAVGIALYALKYTRPLAITLLVLGLMSFYGLPVVLGLVHPTAPAYGTDEDVAKGVLQHALANSSVPLKLTVRSANGAPLHFSYLRYNTSVELNNLPLNSSVAERVLGSRGSGKGNLTYQFTYGRFYNETYHWDVVCVEMGDNTDPTGIGNIGNGTIMCRPLYVDYNRIDPSYVQLYKNSTLRHLWYLGIYLRPSEGWRTFDCSGCPTLLDPIFDLPADVLSAAGQVLTGFASLKGEADYYERVYGRVEHSVIADTVFAMNRNATSFALWNETSLPSWKPDYNPPGPQTFTYSYSMPRKEYSCWLARTYNVTDPSTGENRTVHVYAARASYSHMTPWDQRLPFARLGNTATRILFKGNEFLLDENGTLRCARPYGCSSGTDGASGWSLNVDPVGGDYLAHLNLADGAGPLTLPINLAVAKEKQMPDVIVREAERIRGNVGRGSGTVHTIEEPEVQTLILDPKTQLYAVGISRWLVLEAEQEESCPTFPERIDESVSVTLIGEEIPAWDPYDLGLIHWSEYAKSGSYEVSYDQAKGLTFGAFVPSDPRALHRLYEEDPREPIARTDPNRGAEMAGFGNVLSSLLYSSFAVVAVFVGADTLSSLLGGVSTGLSSQLGGLVRGFMGFRLPSLNPFSSRNPALFKESAMHGAKGLLKFMETVNRKSIERLWTRAVLERDYETIGRIERLRALEEELKWAKRKRTLLKVITHSSPIAFAASKLIDWRTGVITRMDRRIADLEKRREGVLSQLLPQQATTEAYFRRLSEKVKIGYEEAVEIVRREREKHGRWAYLAMLGHTEGIRTLRAYLFGIPTEVSRGWARWGFDAPLASKTLGLRGENYHFFARRDPLLPGEGSKVIHSAVLTTQKHLLKEEKLGRDEVKDLASVTLEAYRRAQPTSASAETAGRDLKDEYRSGIAQYFRGEARPDASSLESLDRQDLREHTRNLSEFFFPIERPKDLERALDDGGPREFHFRDEAPSPKEDPHYHALIVRSHGSRWTPLQRTEVEITRQDASEIRLAWSSPEDRDGSHEAVRRMVAEGLRERMSSEEIERAVREKTSERMGVDDGYWNDYAHRLTGWESLGDYLRRERRGDRR